MKQYYWLKLKEGFFEEKTSCCLRGMPEGETLLIIYIKMLLAGIRSEGVIEYGGVYPNYAEEIAVQLNEDPKLVHIAIEVLVRLGAVELSENNDVLLTRIPFMIGSETDSAERMRKLRAKRKGLPEIETSLCDSK
jgi:predicted phage replisome organizer